MHGKTTVKTDMHDNVSAPAHAGDIAIRINLQNKLTLYRYGGVKNPPNMNTNHLIISICNMTVQSGK